MDAETFHGPSPRVTHPTSARRPATS